MACGPFIARAEERLKKTAAVLKGMNPKQKAENLSSALLTIEKRRRRCVAVSFNGVSWVSSLSRMLVRSFEGRDTHCLLGQTPLTSSFAGTLVT